MAPVDWHTASGRGLGIGETSMPLLLLLLSFIAMGSASLAQADGEILGFAVVSEAPKDKARVVAKVSVNE